LFDETIRHLLETMPLVSIAQGFDLVVAAG
jgi:hypothetical protein